VNLMRCALSLGVLAFRRCFGAGPGLGRVDVRMPTALASRRNLDP
jgi:hypothetical protein